MTFCFLTFCLLAFSGFDFLPFDFYLFDFLSFDFLAFDFLSFDFLSFDFLSCNHLSTAGAAAPHPHTVPYPEPGVGRLSQRWRRMGTIPVGIDWRMPWADAVSHRVAVHPGRWRGVRRPAVTRSDVVEVDGLGHRAPPPSRDHLDSSMAPFHYAIAARLVHGAESQGNAPPCHERGESPAPKHRVIVRQYFFGRAALKEDLFQVAGDLHCVGTAERAPDGEPRGPAVDDG